ncbi:MAG: NADH dehydrogenase subunit, partial [Bacteroidota bacterium]
EQFGIKFTGHPWLKPVRYSCDRFKTGSKMQDYPFFNIESSDLHEVGVGPVHAGIIEPGYFRFICNGEQVLHLEIQLGYQHRGIEKLFTTKKELPGLTILSENIAGDTTVGHAITFVQLAEALAGRTVSDGLHASRAIALEMERIAMHIADTAALCTDVAYQFGQVVNEPLRTAIINTIQLWCGNRFAKGLIRPGGTNYPFTEDFSGILIETLAEISRRYEEITKRVFSLDSVLTRFEDTGKVTTAQLRQTGAVGVAARSGNLLRDIRKTHPSGYFRNIDFEPVILEPGDVWARAKLRSLEVLQSVSLIGEIAGKHQGEKAGEKPDYKMKFMPDALAVSLTEGWRGEICHAAVTDGGGEIRQYKVKDPSMHNWLALALAVREHEISDFPLCNKSFNLSYCGHDL